MKTLKTLPNDAVRQIMWRYAERFDMQMLVQNARAVARGPVARLVADGARNSHEWTAEKDSLLEHFDMVGITAAGLDPEFGGYIDGPKNLALALMAAELSWVDGGAATCSMATILGYAPIHEKGTPEQSAHYQAQLAPIPGRKTRRAAFALTEPLPFVGVDTGVVSGRLRIAEWNDGEEPILTVEKRGRFITSMAFANIVTVAVQSDDPRIHGTCMVILEDTDEGLFDRGTPSRKMVHQLSSTRDPIFALRVPANRIIGGYTVRENPADGTKILVPNCEHGNVIESVFKRTRVTVGAMSPAKLLSALEPIIRYQRTRFRGGDATEGTVRYERGIQGKEDAVMRLADVWAMGEMTMAMAMEAAYLYDELDPIEVQKKQVLATQGITGGRAELKALRPAMARALELQDLPDVNDTELLPRYVLLDALANTMCPATKRMCGAIADTMREAVSLMGGYGLTEDCPGFLFHKWTDCQLEATYEGPECVQRRQLSVTMTNPLFLKNIEVRAANIEHLAPTAAATVRLWASTLRLIQAARDTDGKPLYTGTRHGVTFPLADACTYALAALVFAETVQRLHEQAATHPELAATADDDETLPALLECYADLATVAATRAAGEVVRLCTETVYGYLANNETAPAEFIETRAAVERTMTASRYAKERVAHHLTHVMIPQALDYP